MGEKETSVHQLTDSCISCKEKIYNTCASPRGRIGFSLGYGGFSEYSLASVPLTVKIPSGLDDVE